MLMDHVGGELSKCASDAAHVAWAERKRDVEVDRAAE